MSMSYPTRLLELHSHYAWDQDYVRKAMRFAANHRYTGLVLHRNDIIDFVVYPSVYFGANPDREYRNIHERYQDIFRSLYRHTPHRRSVPNIRRDYLKWVGEEATRLGLEFWLENKEICFPDILVEFFPEVLENGKVCPTHPSWPEFLRVKYTELLADLPGITGVITSPGTSESRISIAGNRCTCERCAKTAPEDWYYDILMAIYEPLRAAKKTLVVRDFVFDSTTHAGIAAAMERLPADVVVSLKNTPHDYYPTFPHNPRIGKVGGHRQWIEYDVMGQYYGWGIAPAIMLDDLKYRFDYGLQNGAEGVLIRIDWESLESHSCLRTLNLVNLYGAGAIAFDPSVDHLSIIDQWLTEQEMLRCDLDEETKRTCVAFVQQILGQTWEVTRRALYTNGCVFSDSSTFPVSLEHAWWLAEEKNSLQDWDRSKRGALDPTDTNVRLILEEKHQALNIWNGLWNQLTSSNPGLTQEAYEDLKDQFAVFGLYVRGFSLIGQTAILSRRLTAPPATVRETPGQAAEALPDDRRAHERQLASLLRDLHTYENDLREFHNTAHGRDYVVSLLLNPERIRAFIEDVQRETGVPEGNRP